MSAPEARSCMWVWKVLPGLRRYCATFLCCPSLCLPEAITTPLTKHHATRVHGKKPGAVCMRRLAAKRAVKCLWRWSSGFAVWFLRPSQPRKRSPAPLMLALQTKAVVCSVQRRDIHTPKIQIFRLWTVDLLSRQLFPPALLAGTLAIPYQL